MDKCMQFPSFYSIEFVSGIMGILKYCSMKCIYGKTYSNMTHTKLYPIQRAVQIYMLRKDSFVYTVIVNNATKINKTNNHLSPQAIEPQKDHDIWHWKSRSWLIGTGQKKWN